MEQIEPIVRFVEAQLNEVLPLLLESASNSDDEDFDAVELKKPALVLNSARGLQKDRFPLIVVDAISSVPVDEDQDDDMAVECTGFQHLFNVFFMLSDSDPKRLTWATMRYAHQIKEAIRNWHLYSDTAEIRDRCFAEAGLSPVAMNFVALSTNHTDAQPNGSILVRECWIEFVCYT